MKTLLKLRHNNAASPFLSRAALDLVTARGPATVVRGAAGERSWLLDESVTEFTLSIRIPYEGSASAVASPNQRAADALAADRWGATWLAIDTYRLAQGALVRVSAPPPPAAGPEIVTSLDLRSRIRGVSTGGEALGAGSVITVDVDLSFLEATNLIAATERTRLVWDNTDGCLVRMYQYTGEGGRCSAVAVVIPPALKSGAAVTAIDTLMFFCPVSPAGYRSVHGVGTGQLWRYLNRLGGRSDPRYFGFWGHSRGPDTERHAYPWPFCRFAQQLKDSGRRVMLVLPQSNGGQYAPFDGPAWTAVTGARSDALLDSLIKAVQADGSLAGGAGARRTSRGRVGVAGFSFGGGTALTSFDHNRARVDELYLFDPNGFARGSRAQQVVKAWVATPGRRLRLIAGMHTGAMIPFAREALAALGGEVATTLDPSHDRRAEPMSSDPSVLVFPSSEAFFTRSEDYKFAYARSDDPQVTAVGTPREGALTQSTCLYACPPEPGGPRFVARLPDGTLTPPEALPGHSFEEAVFRVWMEEPVGLFTAPRFRAMFSALRSRAGNGIPPPDWMRHQWTVFGGQSATDRHDASFRGYLQMCLDTSGFAR